MHKPLFSKHAVALTSVLQCGIDLLRSLGSILASHAYYVILTARTMRVFPTSRCTRSCRVPTRSAGKGGYHVARASAFGKVRIRDVCALSLEASRVIPPSLGPQFAAGGGNFITPPTPPLAGPVPRARSGGWPVPLARVSDSVARRGPASGHRAHHSPHGGPSG